MPKVLSVHTTFYEASIREASNGHEVVSSQSSTSTTIMPKVLSDHTTFYEASIKEAFNDITKSETVLNCLGAGSSSSASSCKNKNGLPHLSHSINKDISSTFPLKDHVSKEHNAQEHFHGTIHCKPKGDTHNGPLWVFPL